MTDHCRLYATDCFAYGKNGTCNVLAQTTGYTAECPFRKTREQRMHEHSVAAQKLVNMGRDDLIRRYMIDNRYLSMEGSK